MQLRSAGVRMGLWDPADDSALRLLVTTAFATQKAVEERRSPRVPTALRGRAFDKDQRKDVSIYTLSAGGAFLETPTPFRIQSVLRVEIELPDGTLEARARVVYARDPRGRGEKPDQPYGMGVQFAGLDPAAGRRIRDFLELQKDRFAV